LGKTRIERELLLSQPSQFDDSRLGAGLKNSAWAQYCPYSRRRLSYRDQSLPAHRRALIVEDEPLFAMGLAADMQALGFDTRDLAANGQDAFLQAMEDEPDIVLMDINLEGGREGIEAARWLREVCDIPIVFVTAYRSRYRPTHPSTGARRAGHRKATLP
jgi:CheY-like chemotaxis protein